MSTKMNVPEFLLDKRILQRNIDRGLLDAKAAEKHLQTLPDLADNVALTQVDDDDTEANDDEE